ncbi:MAG: hypothetical protein KC912_26280 [Proteobacteria bacterium]|nr:hypothetical protein [Pseudomonadota bacterium]
MLRLAPLLLLPQLAMAGDCPDYASLGTTTEVAGKRLAEAEALYPVIFDEIGQLPDIDTWIVDGVSCLTEPASPSLAARYHRFRAVNTDPLGGLSDVVRPQVLASLTAAARLDPSYSPTLPEEHGHRGVEPTPGESVEVPSPSEGALFFDGSQSLMRPGSSATFFQRTDAAGQIVDSVYLYPSDALPDYPRVLQTTAELPDGRKAKRLRIAGVGLGVGALTLFAGNLATRHGWKDGTREQAHDRQLLINGLAISSWVAGAGSAALLTTSFVVK